MNAYELSDALQANTPYALVESAYTLRQQADKLHKYELRNQEQIKRIAELEKELEHTKGLCMLKNMQVNVLRKTNAEPVAWMQTHHETRQATKFSPVKVWEDDIPLYTTPHHASDVKQTKPLSDEEIHYAVKRWKMKYNYKHDADVHESLHEFARAIEERHGIK